MCTISWFWKYENTHNNISVMKRMDDSNISQMFVYCRYICVFVYIGRRKPLEGDALL